MSTIAPTKGTLPFVVDSETFKTWYTVYGSLQDRKRRPIIVLHGGPGMTHDYMLSCAKLAASGAPVIFYDQIGNGKSTHLADKPAAFWTIELFMLELDNLLKQLNIEDDYDLLGHSWGGMLALEYEVSRHPAGLKHIILANSLASMADWDASCGQLISAFPPEVSNPLMAGPMADRNAFLGAMRKFEAEHGCRVKPLPNEVYSALEVVYGENGDATVDKHMFAGPLKKWTIVDRLGDVRASVPCLVINGAKDMASDVVVEPLEKLIPTTKRIKYLQSSHMPHWEEEDKFMKDILDFVAK